MGLGGWAYQSQLSAFAVTQLKMDAQGYGWLLAVNGLGACTAALFIAARGSHLVRVKSLYAGACIYAIFILLFGFMHRPVGAAFLLFFAGFGIIFFYSIGNSTIQTQSPDHLRGRLMGIWALVLGGSMPIGSLWMGTVAQKVGSGHALQAGGIFCSLGASTVYFLGRKSRG
jgi:MFS family permease